MPARNCQVMSLACISHRPGSSHNDVLGPKDAGGVPRIRAARRTRQIDINAEGVENTPLSAPPPSATFVAATLWDSPSVCAFVPFCPSLHPRDIRASCIGCRLFVSLCSVSDSLFRLSTYGPLTGRGGFSVHVGVRRHRCFPWGGHHVLLGEVL